MLSPCCKRIPVWMLNGFSHTSVLMALLCWLVVKSLLQDFRIQRKRGRGTQRRTWPAGICSPAVWRWRGQSRPPGKRPCASRPNASLRTKGSVRGSHPGRHVLLLQHGELQYVHTWLWQWLVLFRTTAMNTDPDTGDTQQLPLFNPWFIYPLDKRFLLVDGFNL